MARLAAIEKGLYYPTPTRVFDLIARTVRAPEGYVTLLGGSPYPPKLLDPCAGEGTAAAELARAWGMSPHGVELDADRCAAAHQRFVALGGPCLHGSYHQLNTVQDFSVLFCNPPYDEGLSADGQSIRQEVQFLKDCSEWIVPAGLLVFIVPARILKNEVALDLLKRKYDQIACFQFPEPEFQAYKQVVVLARRSSTYYSYSNVDCLRADVLPVLDETSEYRWSPPSLRTCTFTFKLEGENPLALCPDASEGVYGSKAWDLLVGPKGGVPERPLVAPRPGHRAMLLAAGALDGAELDGNRLLKGGSEKIIEKSTEESVDDQGCKTETIIERERIVSRLAVLDLATGECDSWRVDQQPEKTGTWFQEHGQALAAAILRCHTPEFDSDLKQYETRLATLTAPGILPGRTAPELLPVQKETAAAVVHRWRRHKTTIVSGEMGTGKTTIATVACELRELRKVVVVCPGHLVSKWKREVEKITGRKGTASIAKKLSDLDTFFASDTLSYLVLSKETAKLGAKWEPRFTVRKLQVTREVVDTESPSYRSWSSYGQPMKVVRQILEVVSCPDCGEMQKAGESRHMTVAEVDVKQKMACQNDKCRSPLWQVAPVSSKGTMRWPLAERLSQKYTRRYSLIIDECHQYAGADSDQSRAVQDLVSGARKVLAMTGTLYGGRASSIFHLLFKCEPSFREQYQYGDSERFSTHHGLFESKFETRETISTYGYKRGGKEVARTKEIPGMAPAMIPLLLPFCVFVKLRDLQLELPSYSESVEVVDHVPAAENAVRRMQDEIKAILREHPEALGAYLQACLGYPDRAEEAEDVTTEDRDGHTLHLASAPAIDLPEDGCWPKDRRVVELAKAEHESGRKTLVFCTQVHRRDARQRLKAALEAAGLRVAILDSSVQPDKREAWLTDAAGSCDVLLTNGRLVETGLDLLAFPTIVQFGVEYSLATLRQSIRRSWRLGQREPVRVIFLGYANTMQETALNLIARKMRAAELVDGDEAGGLAQFDPGGSDFFLELAHEAIQQADRRQP